MMIQPRPIIGAHLRNEVRLKPQDRDRYREGRFEGAVVFAYQDPVEVRAMGVWPRHSVVRLSDSIDGGRIWGEQAGRNVGARDPSVAASRLPALPA